MGHALGESISGLIKKPTFSCSLHSTPGPCLRLGVYFPRFPSSAIGKLASWQGTGAINRQRTGKTKKTFSLCLHLNAKPRDYSVETDFN
jgi:hypothetical protein